MFSLAPTLRALTTGSPITTAIREAHQMARRHFDTGGATTAARGLQAAEGFLVPSGIDTVALEAAIEAKLRASLNAGSGRSGGPFKLLERRPVERLIGEMRSRRIVMAGRARQH